MLFSCVFWSKRGGVKNMGSSSHLARVKRCYILEQPKRLLLRIARICSYLPYSPRFPSQWNDQRKWVPTRSCKISMNWNVNSSRIFSILPAYRLHAARSRSGYAGTVSGPTTSAPLKLFVKIMLINHRCKSKQIEPTMIFFHMMVFYFGRSTSR